MVIISNMIDKIISYKKQFDLGERVAVVTGATGILGKLFCAGLAEFGAKIAVVDLDENVTLSYAKVLQERYGTECMGIACDVSKPEEIKKMANAVETTLGVIDILHNNAATKGNDLEEFFAPLEEYSLETWREIMSVNLDGQFLVAKEIGTRMASRGKGSIIQTASIYGASMGPDQRIYQGSEYMGMAINTPPPYPVSKSGIVGLTNYLATYWAKKGVRVNTLTPGGVESGQNDIFSKKYSARVPMERMANGNEMVGALVFLASDASSYITGQNIFIDGGLSVW
jgi:NAD(P)-dependent dehydrogenase (short-subunit alcohol dehydrogenase family)